MKKIFFKKNSKTEKNPQKPWPMFFNKVKKEISSFVLTKF